MENILYEQQGFIGKITINRPKAMNALNSQTLVELGQVLDAIDVNSVRCVIVTGAGDKSFVAGADIAQMSTATRKEGEDYSAMGNAVFRKLEQLPMPTIAAINGFALGGGCEIAMSCDIRMCSDNAIFAQPEVGLGITPGFGGTQRLPRLINVGKAKEMIYTTNVIKAEEALKLGLVTYVYKPEELMPAAMKLAEKIAKMAPIAVRASKKAINEGLQVDIDKAVAIEVKNFAICIETEDQRGSMKAFVEKTKFEGFKNK